ncbi:CotS family spore coat protein [Clostridium sp. OS1-26]|uniref:CotS family spore coat protein n=1 Tax=Clostridium sp. OS1-26 TaxID=3070681 RepID=UPI0027DF9A78|nr:CotS family spore coat protein [Clostridium sp. OS1-26]WML36564.1 CotS family spore coat protein [Clostridium sp. OS1-26]
MDICDVRKSVQDTYGLQIQYIEKIKNVYKISCDNKQYCLKVIRYDLGHFLFILSAIKHLQNNKFKHIPRIIKTKDGMDYMNIQGGYAYLTSWITSRQCNYDNPVDVLIATSKLAELHKKSHGFNVTENMNPRIGWFKWPETFNTRKNEILDFKKRIDKKDKKTEFDAIYLDAMEEELNRAERSIENLIRSNYLEIMNKEIASKGFCHHDYANHNVLIGTSGEVNIIDFDYCMLDTHLHDLSSLLLRRMKNGKWSINNCIFIIDSYNSVNKVKREDIPVMAAFMEFPQDYWQIGIQYYWEKQPWEEELFLKKLKKTLEDRGEKQDFIDEFEFVKYN